MSLARAASRSRDLGDTGLTWDFNADFVAFISFSDGFPDAQATRQRMTPYRDPKGTDFLDFRLYSYQSARWFGGRGRRRG